MAKIFKKVENYFVVEDSITGIKELETPSKDVYMNADRELSVIKFNYKDQNNNGIIKKYTFEGVQTEMSSAIMSGASGSIDSATINGVSIISGTVPFRIDINTTAADFADKINAHTSSPNYTAIPLSNSVVVLCEVPGPIGNGAFVVTATTLTTLEVNDVIIGTSNLLDGSSVEYLSFEDMISGTTGVMSITGV